MGSRLASGCMRSVGCGLDRESIAKWGVMRTWLLGWVCRWACALYNACSRVVVSCSALYAASAKEASGQVVLVYGRAPKTASLG